MSSLEINSRLDTTHRYRQAYRRTDGQTDRCGHRCRLRACVRIVSVHLYICGALLILRDVSVLLCFIETLTYFTNFDVTLKCPIAVCWLNWFPCWMNKLFWVLRERERERGEELLSWVELSWVWLLLLRLQTPKLIRGGWLLHHTVVTDWHQMNHSGVGTRNPALRACVRVCVCVRACACVCACVRACMPALVFISTV
jgi:hypothetical protein